LYDKDVGVASDLQARTEFDTAYPFLVTVAERAAEHHHEFPHSVQPFARLFLRLS
jgi:hypothetical protein